jgi:hypothetical protein
MAYIDLIVAVFGEHKCSIAEDDFLRILPVLCGDLPTKRGRWNGTMFSRLLTARFGLGGVARRTLKDCGDEFGVGAERIRQLEAKLLRRLRHPHVSVKYLTPNVRGNRPARLFAQVRLTEGLGIGGDYPDLG